jgi:pyruvate/2-oxoacid:ferredoxin oxidoreductase beta subunit
MGILTKRDRRSESVTVYYSYVNVGQHRLQLTINRIDRLHQFWLEVWEYPDDESWIMWMKKQFKSREDLMQYEKSLRELTSQFNSPDNIFGVPEDTSELEKQRQKSWKHKLKSLFFQV